MRGAERDIVCLRGLLKEKMMLRRGRIDRSQMRFLYGNDIGGKCGRCGEGSDERF